MRRCTERRNGQEMSPVSMQEARAQQEEEVNLAGKFNSLVPSKDINFHHEFHMSSPHHSFFLADSIDQEMV